MVLQGDLDSFALPDVLRLLAGTGKTGRLAIDAAGTTGELWLLDGDLVGGEVATAQHASRPADVVFEIVRLEGGAFLFEDGERLVDGTERSRVADAIEEAEALLAEWTEVEAVVPSVHGTVGLVAEIDGEEVIVAADQWRVLAAIGRGTTVRQLGDHFELTDLMASRQVKNLVEAGLVELGEPTEDRLGRDGEPSEAVSNWSDHQRLDIGASPGGPVTTTGDHGTVDDQAIFRSEDGAVVMEDSDDALLPEPLPGVGTQFDGDVDALGPVDGRETLDEVTADGLPPVPVAGAVDDVAPSSWAEPADDEATATTDPSADATAEPEDEHEEDDDDDRASLMRFLSTVDS